MCSHQAKLFHSAHTATARQLTSWLSSLAMVSGLHFALATTWRWSLRLLALFAWLRSARKAASEYLRGIAWVGSTYALGERLHTIQKSERHGGRRFTDRFAREHDSEFGPQIARRKVLPPRVGGARRRVLDLRGAKEELLRATLCFNSGVPTHRYCTSARKIKLSISATRVFDVFGSLRAVPSLSKAFAGMAGKAQRKLSKVAKFEIRSLVQDVSRERSDLIVLLLATRLRPD